MHSLQLSQKSSLSRPLRHLLLAIVMLTCIPWEMTLAADAKQQFLTFPVNSAYCGAFLDFGTSEDKVTLEAIEKFERMVGKHQAIIASSSFWGELTFPAKNVSLIVRHGSVPLIFWSPWDRPYIQEKPPDRFGLEEILAGKWDAYIDQWALGAKEADTPLLVSWGLEMNGNWFPWSGSWYGGEHPGASGVTGPELFKKAYRYVVDRVRARGASNILWGFHANHYTYPHDGWNRMSRYYPGSEYVDWLGLSVYGKQFAEDDWASFRDVMEEGYQEIALLDQEKPIIVAEFGVAEFPKDGSKAQWLDEAFDLLRDRYFRVRGAVYWHERWPNADGSYSNLRVNSSPEALAAFRRQIGTMYWLDRPQLQHKKTALAP